MKEIYKTGPIFSFIAFGTTFFIAKKVQCFLYIQLCALVEISYPFLGNTLDSFVFILYIFEVKL